jgi:hypothetical protein
MRSRRAHHQKAPPHKPSARRKLSVLGLAMGAAALQFYLANIPRSVELPQDEIDEKTVAKADNERIEIDQPTVERGGVLISYSGQAGEVADLHFEYAIVDPSNAKLQPSLEQVKPVPARIGYVSLPAATEISHATSTATGGDTCHTFIEVQRANGSSPITSLNLFLLNGSTNNEQRREIRAWSDGGALAVEIHTDPPPSAERSQTKFDAIPDCRKMLEVRPLEGADPIMNVDVPLALAPLRLIVPGIENQKASSPDKTFRIRLTSAFANPLRWLSADDMFTGVSLGDSSLESKQVRVLHFHAQSGERLKLTAASNSSLLLDRLGFSLNALKLRVSGRSWVQIDGEPLGFNFMRFLKENPILAGVLTLINASILLLVKETFFRRVDADLEVAEEP